MTPEPPDLSPLALFLMADPVVKAVMLALGLASIACWTVIIEKLGVTRRLRREARDLAAAATAAVPMPATAPDRADLTAAALREDLTTMALREDLTTMALREDLTTMALRAGLPEWRIGQGVRETDGEFRSRLDGAMRKAVAGALKPASSGLQLLATTGAVAPFVGLFGTVWGIMNSFSGIAASNDTSLAVVAPGIAEALFATAIGLVAAIPAVIAYNRLSATLAGLRQEALGAATQLAHRLARTGTTAGVVDRRQSLHAAE